MFDGLRVHGDKVASGPGPAAAWVAPDSVDIALSLSVGEAPCSEPQGDLRGKVTLTMSQLHYFWKLV